MPPPSSTAVAEGQAVLYLVAPFYMPFRFRPGSRDPARLPDPFGRERRAWCVRAQPSSLAGAVGCAAILLCCARAPPLASVRSRLASICAFRLALSPPCRLVLAAAALHRAASLIIGNTDVCRCEAMGGGAPSGCFLQGVIAGCQGRAR
jgi:hypothetical protein